MTAGVLEPFSYGADEIKISPREYLRYMGAGAESDGVLNEWGAKIPNAAQCSQMLQNKQIKSMHMVQSSSNKANFQS